ncbi:MAG: nucleotidyltransferase [Suipraeoptans sp.]
MKITGLITEYNPFHTGHEYHIRKSKQITNADYIVVVMSGDFVQRGTPAIMSKHLRAKIALDAGADLILELPAYYSTSSAEGFAFGGVSLLENLNVIDNLCFGSETSDIIEMKKIASILNDEPDAYSEVIRQELSKGLSYPMARETALLRCLNGTYAKEIISKPNNILGVEYIKALLRLNSSITPYSIARIDSNYHDDHIGELYSSATALRNIILGSHNFDDILNQLSPFLPLTCFDLLKENYKKKYPIEADDFSLLLKAKLLTLSKEELLTYSDINEDLANKILKQTNSFISFSKFCDLLKSKDLTYTRISRVLTHILLDMKYISNAKKLGSPYARVLGFKKDSQELLSEISKKSSIPIITKLGKTAELNSYSNLLLNQDIASSNLYESVVTNKFSTPFINEHQKSIVF